ncbi:MAG: IS1096 element passenger TnpR family protein, partial [Bacteroidota bacterium]
AIHSAIGFDGAKTASFYLSDDHWTKGKEFSNRELKETEIGVVTPLKKSRLCDTIIDPHQKIYYIFDPEKQWSFRIEMIKILPAEELAAVYPRCIKVTGEAPKQYPSMANGPLPVPEDFDPDILLHDEDVDDEVEAEGGEEVVATAEDVSDMGELDTNEGESDENDDFQPADDEMMDEESGERDEF